MSYNDIIKLALYLNKKDTGKKSGNEKVEMRDINTILIAEDHPLFVQKIAELLLKQFPLATVTFADTVIELEKLIKKSSYDLIILDLVLKDKNALFTIGYIRTLLSDTVVLVFSGYPEKIFAPRVLQQGADGYISKHCTEEELVYALQQVTGGEKFLSKQVQNDITIGFLTGKKKTNPFENLSGKEFDVVMLLIEGKSVLEVGKALYIQSSTVCTHKKNAFNKLNIANLSDLNKLAMANGLLL